MGVKVIERNARVWKVVRNVDGERLSGLKGLPKDWEVEYRPGRWTSPNKKSSALFAFRTRQQARQWTDEGEIWKCKADIVNGELQLGKRIVYCGTFGAQAFARFWRSTRKSALAETATGLEGGLWCKRIKLEERA